MLKDILYRGQDIYKDFIPDDDPDLQGWGSDDPIFSRLIERLAPALIVEVGTWKGRCAINMAKKIRDMGLSCEIICVDTWLGSTEHWLATAERQSWRDSLRLQHGYPQLYRTFLSNVITHGCQNYITPIPLPSDSAFVLLKQFGIVADLIYIDASHEYDSAFRDLSSYWQILKEGGILIVDDYAHWPEVARAVDQFASDLKLEICKERNKAVIPKNSAVRIAE
jgi:hypothetical protein